jgi:sugar lactone lactonase YvrE
MADFTIERVGTSVDLLGEGILWDAQSQLLYWVDAYSFLIHELDLSSGRRRDFSTNGAKPGCLALRESGGAILALENGFYFYDFATGQLTPVPGAPVIEDKNLRYNDGKVDRQGRFLAGTVQIPPPPASEFRGWLCRVDADLSVSYVEQQVGACNGPCFSPDGRTLYVADSGHYAIYAYDYDTADGTLSNKRLFVDTSPYKSKPDGATVDADGCMWTTFVDASKVLRYTPDGKLDRELDVPIRYPSNVSFGGSDLKPLFVTSISRASRFQATEPDAGGLFAITGLGVTGLPEPRFRG